MVLFLLQVTLQEREQRQHLEQNTKHLVATVWASWAQARALERRRETELIRVRGNMVLGVWQRACNLQRQLHKQDMLLRRRLQQRALHAWCKHHFVWQCNRVAAVRFREGRERKQLSSSLLAWYMLSVSVHTARVSSIRKATTAWQLVVLQEKLVQQFVSRQHAQLQLRVMRTWASAATVSAAATKATLSAERSEVASPVALGAAHATARLGRKCSDVRVSLEPLASGSRAPSRNQWVGPARHTPVLSSATLQPPASEAPAQAADPALLQIREPEASCQASGLPSDGHVVSHAHTSSGHTRASCSSVASQPCTSAVKHSEACLQQAKLLEEQATAAAVSLSPHTVCIPEALFPKSPVQHTTLPATLPQWLLSSPQLESPQDGQSHGLERQIVYPPCTRKLDLEQRTEDLLEGSSGEAQRMKAGDEQTLWHLALKHDRTRTLRKALGTWRTVAKLQTATDVVRFSSPSLASLQVICRFLATQRWTWVSRCIGNSCKGISSMQ